MGIFSKSSVSLGDGSIRIASRHFSLDIPYGDIESVALRRDIDLGRIVTGTQGGLTYAGRYRNDEFGLYDVLFHPTALVVIAIRYGGGKAVVFNERSAEKTERLFEEIESRRGMMRRAPPRTMRI